MVESFLMVFVCIFIISVIYHSIFPSKNAKKEKKKPFLESGIVYFFVILSAIICGFKDGK